MGGEVLNNRRSLSRTLLLALHKRAMLGIILFAVIVVGATCSSLRTEKPSDKDSMTYQPRLLNVCGDLLVEPLEDSGIRAFVLLWNGDNERELQVVVKSLMWTGTRYNIVLLRALDAPTMTDEQVGWFEHLGVLFRDSKVAYDEHFIKIHLWSLVNFEKIVFLESNVLVSRNIDHLFDVPGTFAAVCDTWDAVEDSWRDCEFETGMMVLEPSTLMYKKLRAQLTSYLDTLGGESQLPESGTRRRLAQSGGPRAVGIEASVIHAREAELHPEQGFFNSVLKKGTWTMLPLRYNTPKTVTKAPDSYDADNLHIMRFVGIRPLDKVADVNSWKSTYDTKDEEMDYQTEEIEWYHVLREDPPAPGIFRPELGMMKQHYAYVTLVTSDMDAKRAVSLSNKLAAQGSQHPLVVMCLGGAFDSTRGALEAAGIAVIRVELPDPKYITPKFRMAMNEVGFVSPLWVKLHLWALPFNKVIFLDIRGTVMNNLDHLFASTPWEVTTNGEWSSEKLPCGGSLMVVEPSQYTYTEMIRGLSSHFVSVAYLTSFNNFIEWYFRGSLKMAVLPFEYGCRPADLKLDKELYSFPQ